MQHQNEKRKQLLEHESEKLKNLESNFSNEMKVWKDQLKPRKKVCFYLNSFSFKLNSRQGTVMVRGEPYSIVSHSPM